MRSRRDSLRGNMLNYSTILVASLALTSFVLIVKYRDLSYKLTEEYKVHQISKKSLEDDLLTEVEQKRKLEIELDMSKQSLNSLQSKVKGVEQELTNTVQALQMSNNKIEELQRDINLQTEQVNQLKVDNRDLQTNNDLLQDELSNKENELKKTMLSADDDAKNLKDTQDRMEKLLTDNQRLTQQVSDAQSLQGEISNLRTELLKAQDKATKDQIKLDELQNKANVEEGAKKKQIVDEKKKQIVDEKKQIVDKKLADKENPKPKDNVIENPKGSETGEKKPLEKPSGDGLEDYEMLEEDVKEEVKKELQLNKDEPAIKASGEVLDEAVEDPAKDVPVVVLEVKDGDGNGNVAGIKSFEGLNAEDIGGSFAMDQRSFDSSLNGEGRNKV